MRACLAILLCVGAAAVVSAEVPDVDAFRAVPHFPPPAAGATITRGTTDSLTGRLLLWDGDAVFYQDFNNNAVGASLTEVATGYLGDPSFVSFHSNNRRFYLGSGADGLVYDIPDIRNPVDFEAGMEFEVVTFHSGTLLNDELLILDRVRNDMTGSEIVVVNIALAHAESMQAMRAVLQKPAGSLPAEIFVDRGAGRTYIMDAATRELRWFATSALRDAYNNSMPLSWTGAGTLVGSAGQFLNGGVFGVNPDGELLIGGDTGVAGTGGIQYVDPTAPASIIATLDPAGTGPPYVLVYSRRLDEVVAIDPSVAPPVAYASEEFIPALPPDSPCLEFDEIDLEFAEFIADFAPGVTDLDDDEIRDTAMLQLLEIFSCRANSTSALAFSTNTAYDDNREVFATEANAMALEPYERILPILLSMNQAMRAEVLDRLATGGFPLTGTYATISCTDLENCLPEFVEDPVVARNAPRGVTEPYTASGDPDGDGLTNLEEYMNNEAKGGDDLDFAAAAASPELDGSDGRLNPSGCFIATAAYGTPLAAELDDLRGIRDAWLLTSPAGAAFADVYYRVSPPAAAWIADRPAARAAVRLALAPLFVSWQGAALAVLAVAGLAAVARGRRKPAAVPRK